MAASCRVKENKIKESKWKEVIPTVGVGRRPIDGWRGKRPLGAHPTALPRHTWKWHDSQNRVVERQSLFFLE